MPKADEVTLGAVRESIALHRDRTVELLRALVRVPSVNHPPGGDEKAVQFLYADTLRAHGLDAELRDPLSNRGFLDHPARLTSHDMRERPNVVARLAGIGGGRSLLLVAHADVEAPGPVEIWTGGDPFSGDLRDGKVYGRGAGDDKCGMAINAMIPVVLASAGIRLHGDLLIASVADEEQGGSNGAVALVAGGVGADAAINVDGIDRQICISALGGGSVDVEVNAPEIGEDATAVVESFNAAWNGVRTFHSRRAIRFSADPLHCPAADRAVRVYDVHLAPSGHTHTGSFRCWLYLLPGEDPREVRRDFERTVSAAVSGRIEFRWMERLVESSRLDPGHPLVAACTGAHAAVGGEEPLIAGCGMCDMGFLSNHGGFPCVTYGPGRLGRAGGAHEPDEFVEVDELIATLHTLTLVTLEWCGYQRS